LILILGYFTKCIKTNLTWLFKRAANIKCRYPIAISDCFSISLAILQECPVFFLPEYELSKDTAEKN